MTAFNENNDDDDTSFDYIFGFGSIINTETHASWLLSSSASSSTNSSCRLDGEIASLSKRLGYQRGWYFRSNTGFTALGVKRVTNDGSSSDMNGVLFRVPKNMLAAFDRREIGYDRIELPLEGVLRQSNTNDNNNTQFHIQKHEKLWIYVPQPQYCLEADPDHPILQSYVDTVLQGCLEWGGGNMAQRFIHTTTSWSSYFLNDTPSSRRPWLYRKQYDVIDQLLSENVGITHFNDRKHPEEFSKTLLSHMRGTWALPPRNNVFTGRDVALRDIHAKLVLQRTENLQSGRLARLEIVGMGGIGKTSVCVEYCYRYFPSYYGLVVWLSAQSAEAITLGYKQLMADTTGVDVKEKTTDDVLAEVKTRLFRSKVPWLLVFDNLEDRALLDKFLPHGGPYGHVLITTRIVGDADHDDHQIMPLGCFRPTESVDLLCRSAGKENIGENRIQCEAAQQLAERLGHLPLALGVAAAYMKRCDVECSEYLARYEQSERSGSQALGHEAVSSSLSLSLDAIQQESTIASEVLFLLAYLAPDHITKPILRALLQAKQRKADLDADNLAAASETGNVIVQIYPYAFAASSVAACASLLLMNNAKTSAQRRSAGIGLVASVSAPALIHLSRWYMLHGGHVSEQPQSSVVLPRKRTGSFSMDVFEQTDRVWKILKSYSLLDVKEGKGSMHRLLSQALRMYQSNAGKADSIEISVRAIQQLWSFKPDQVDSWQPASNILNHVKAVVAHASTLPGLMTLEAAALSREAGMYSAMALNRFEEAQHSLEVALNILNAGTGQRKEVQVSRAACLHELGKVFRYHGSEAKAGDALHQALELRIGLTGTDGRSRRDVAATLHELGILEVKNHNLSAAADFLDQSLRLRKELQRESNNEDVEAECAATLHQLAAVQVAMKPPSLSKAEALLREALTLNMNIGQRAATLKQLARVAIRNGHVDAAENYLAQALELYVELFGENKLHINIAAVRFQQGALAYQCEQLQDAWQHFSECLRARQQIYAYSQGIHLEVSTVLHELGCVALAQKRFVEAKELLHQERQILDDLSETLDQHHRLFHIKLTNLTWLKKCAKSLGDDAEVRAINEARASLKEANNRDATRVEPIVKCLPLQRELLSCRLAARQFALARNKTGDVQARLEAALSEIAEIMQRFPNDSLYEAADKFCQAASAALSKPSKMSAKLLDACDDLRDILREQGLRVNDLIQCKDGCLNGGASKKSK
ncbi:hypothetical protein MPSEU_000972600 [Mayamaea pseudoterrestris]|nr:hypothetical protein MPSEU_000972600 [Mayamaea pseudoterrestris]